MPFKRSGLAAAIVCLSVLSCTPVPDSTPRQEPPLANTAWALAELGGEAIILPPSMQLIDLRFRTGALVTGFTGCNVLTGRYEATDTRLEFREPLSTTLRICPSPALMEQERELLTSLRRTKRYEFAASWLNLYAEDELVARFVPLPTNR